MANDGYQDGSYAMIQKIAQMDRNVKIVSFGVIMLTLGILGEYLWQNKYAPKDKLSFESHPHRAKVICPNFFCAICKADCWVNFFKALCAKQNKKQKAHKHLAKQYLLRCKNMVILNRCKRVDIERWQMGKADRLKRLPFWEI